MEFPDLGKQCCEKSCQQLDFLPMKCDACEEIFCKDHITYKEHKCSSTYKKDVQVPVCPLCNTPIPVKRGEMPDIKVGEHIDRECKSDPAQRQRKIFTNKCTKQGCKQKEMIRVTCDQCCLNFCLRHRHPLDHNCSSDEHTLSKAGNAALMRTQATSTTTSNKGSTRPTPNSVQANLRPPQNSVHRSSQGTSRQGGILPTVSLQGGMSEEEALQRALSLSLADSGKNSSQSNSCQEEEDSALARALAASEEEYQREQQQQRRPQMQNREAKQPNCTMS
ncbi:AN1-type zinc finger protein 2A [Latimeria chalumnae]|uniref:Zinc finger AN1-type containing 2B n=1 Tax=Latimeria chalumnae TaxID=7897 RepID=H3ASF6_LATCH|nr:PREDICTED: AN1-type zinc finger protein 2A isoform X1 [Latimeria chalumnae]XP_006001774.1 PREDICTED: AN1-type zinc finger protein 2A isoform X1 [Latimeria chalumnae]|eukprot:XP_006001773.1 PREDICTED: AN1-type zinc finger protein 2A isoform X1 [Latimeria chalumnae]